MKTKSRCIEMEDPTETGFNPKDGMSIVEEMIEQLQETEVRAIPEISAFTLRMPKHRLERIDEIASDWRQSRTWLINEIITVGLNSLELSLHEIEQGSGENRDLFIEDREK